MAGITVEKIDEVRFKVTVQGQTVTSHTVTVDPWFYEKMTERRVPVETLIEKSFEFLLVRESNTSILRRFDLPAIGSYFPEYETAVKAMLK